MARSLSSGAPVTSKSLPCNHRPKPRKCGADAGRSDGYSQHGDYVFGWKDDSLQRAMNANCNGDKCKELKSQSSADAMKCTIPPLYKEEINSCKFGACASCLPVHRDRPFCVDLILLT